MPSVADALDLQRYDELRRDAEMALNLWDAFRLACERGDGEIVKHHSRRQGMACGARQWLMASNPATSPSSRRNANGDRRPRRHRAAGLAGTSSSAATIAVE
jgi:hypothetical protein